MKYSLRKVVTFRFLLLVTLPWTYQAVAEDVRNTLAIDGFQYDHAALLEVSKLSTLSEMKKALQEKFGVKVVEVPSQLTASNREKYSAETLTFFHMFSEKQSDGSFHFDAGGYYQPAFADYASSDPKHPLLTWDKRPNGDIPVIILTEGSKREVVLHEFMHHLVEVAAARSAGMSGRDYEFKKNAEMKDALSNGDLEKLIVQFEDRMREELAINATLLGHREEIGMSFQEAQHFLAVNRQNLKTYPEDMARILSNVAAIGSLDASMSAQVAAIRDRHNLRIKSAKDQIEKFNHENFDNYSFLRKLNDWGIILNPSDVNSRDPFKVLGLRPTDAIDNDILRTAFRYWASALHPDRGPDNGGDTALFKKYADARDAILKGDFSGMTDDLNQGVRELWKDLEEARAKELAEADAALGSAARWATRVATMCAAGAAYCSLDQYLPWNRGHGFDFGLWYVGLSTALASMQGQQYDDTDPNVRAHFIRQGVASGIVRGVALATCWELLKLFAGP